MHYCFIANEDVDFYDYVYYDWCDGDWDDDWIFDWWWPGGRFSEWLKLKDWNRWSIAKKKDIDIQSTVAPYYYVDNEWELQEKPFYFEWMSDIWRWTKEEEEKKRLEVIEYDKRFTEWLMSQPEDMNIYVYDWHM